MAYEGAIKAVIEARTHVVNKRIMERSKAITKAQLILQELSKSLDAERGGDLARRLEALYGYMLRQLADANFRQVEEPLAEVQRLLETLNEAWKEVSAKESTTLTAVEQPQYAFAAESPRAQYSL